MDEKLSQQLSLSVSIFVYTHDYYCSVMCGCPFMVGPEFLHSLTIGTFESKLIPLVQFARLLSKSKSYIEQRSIKMKDEWIRVGMSLEIPINPQSSSELSDAFYLKLFHNYLYVLLVRKSLLDPTKNDATSFQLLEESCDYITSIVNMNPNLETIPIFFGQLVYSIGMFCCFRKKDLRELTCSFHVLKVLGHSKILSYQEKALQLEQCLLEPTRAIEYINTKVIPGF
jgi:hypothetical protein